MLAVFKIYAWPFLDQNKTPLLDISNVSQVDLYATFKAQRQFKVLCRRSKNTKSKCKPLAFDSVLIDILLYLDDWEGFKDEKTLTKPYLKDSEEEMKLIKVKAKMK